MNLLIHGPIGSGKTTIIKSFIREYLDKYYDLNLIEFEGSIDNEKITFIEGPEGSQSKLMAFINKSSFNSHQKIILIHDFDRISKDSQMQIKTAIEDNSLAIRFILICNDLQNVIDSIQSLTVSIKFYPFTENDIYEKLLNISVNKNLKLPNEIYKDIAQLCNGDIRLAINYLQCSKWILDVDSFYNIFNISVFNKIGTIVKFLIKSELSKAFLSIKAFIDDGYNIPDILCIIHRFILYSDIADNSMKEIIIKWTIHTVKMSKSSQSLIHLYNWCCKIFSEILYYKN
jgi:DNA polymerase III delta prime subunit